LYGEGHELDGTSVYVELLEAEHAPVSDDGVGRCGRR
jgi:hypothetical protein